jgi:hypothetical protein
VWPGNNKIYFKQNEENRLKLEELASKLSETCSIPEIEFGRGIYIMQLVFVKALCITVDIPKHSAWFKTF